VVTDMLEKTTVMKPYRSYGSISGDGDVPDPVFMIEEQRNYESTLSAQDTLYAKQIVQKLDITFDPDRDDIHSLKQGKLDTRKLAEAVAHNDHIYFRTEEDQKTKPFSVVILCDESGSMNHDGRLGKQYQLVKILHAAFSEIMPQDRISVYGHSGDDVPEIYVYQDKYNPGFTKTIEGMKRRDLRENYDGPVVESLHERIRSQTSDNILMIVISDGSPAGEHGYGGLEAMADLKRIIEKCKRDNFVTMGIGFGYSGVKELYSYNAVIHNMSEVVEKATTLLNKVVKTEFQ
jgi:nitric oxide reductase activation protein